MRDCFNLGNGDGATVLEEIKIDKAQRRPGDPIVCDAWRWEQRKP